MKVEIEFNDCNKNPPPDDRYYLVLWKANYYNGGKRKVYKWWEESRYLKDKNSFHYERYDGRRIYKALYWIDLPKEIKKR